MTMLQEFWEEEDGITTVEILMILAVLVTIALLFRQQITTWVTDTMEDIMGKANGKVETPPEPIPDGPT